MWRGRMALTAVAAVLMTGAVAAAPASAWQVRVPIKGYGEVDETTPANLLNCLSSSTRPDWESTTSAPAVP